MRLGRLAILTIAIAAIVLLAGATTALATARVQEPRVTAQSPAPITLSADPRGDPVPERAPVKRGVQTEKLYPPASPTGPSREETGPARASSGPGPAHSGHDGDDAMRVVLEDDLTVQKTAADTLLDIVVARRGKDSVVRKQGGDAGESKRDGAAAEETATFARGGTTGLNLSVRTGSPTVTTEIVSPGTLVRINSPIPVRATFSEPVSGFTVGDVIVGNGTAGGFVGSDGDAVYTFNVTPNAIGVVTADIPADAAEDGDGNGNTAAAQLWLGIPYDDDRDDGISKYEAISAVRDYFEGQLTKEDTIGVIRLYFQAIAGADSEALELTTAMLEGSVPVPAASFRWEQVNNGSPTVVIANADTGRASFTLPELSNDQDFIFRLTVTYEGGHTSQDTVTVTGRPTPGVIFGAVSGHTASLNGAAEFGIRLRSRPSAEVVIPLSSSDESEGIPEQTLVVFTPENWNRRQVVVVRGQNADVQGGVQNYEIILGNAQSSDRFYDGLEIANVPMKGIALEIAAPEWIEPLIANLPATIEPRVTYTGRNRLSFALTEAPAGMSIDFSYGTITWTPQESDEGQIFDITVLVNDGARSVGTSFQITVVEPEDLETEIIARGVQENVMTVTDADTTLKGLEITSPPEEQPITTEKLAELQEVLEKAPPESVPEIPSWITPISDVFVVKDTFYNPVELRFPLGQLPEGVSVDDVNLYYHGGGHYVGPFWSSVAIEFTFEGTEDEPVFVLTLAGLEGMAFFGYHHTSPPTPFEPVSSGNQPSTVRSDSVSSGNQPSTVRSDSVSYGEQRSTVRCDSDSAILSLCVEPPDTNDIECAAAQHWFGAENHNYITCTYTPDPDVHIYIVNFGEGCRWSIGNNDCPAPGRTREDLAKWAITAQLGLEKLGLEYDKSITIKIEPLDGARGKVSKLEGFKTIHLDDFAYSPAGVRWTLYHEYFHHAQGHPRNIGLTEESFIFLGGDHTLWLVDGMAEWFPDELEDSLNGYSGGMVSSFPRIMEAGINSKIGALGSEDPYKRWPFYKFLTQSCTNFQSQVRNLFGRTLLVGFSLNYSGIIELSNAIDDSSCNFGEHLGEDRKGSLEAAIIYYNYATQLKGELSLLEAYEPSLNFAGPRHDMNGVWNIPAAGAYSFKVRPLQLDQGNVAELVVESADTEIIVSVTSLDPGFEGTNTIGPDENAHLWFSTGDQITQSVHTYGDGTTTPEIFVTLVNPSLTSRAEVEVFFRIRDEVYDFPTEPLGGDRVFLNSGTLNDQQLTSSKPSLSVTPGQAISGTVNLTVANDHRGGAVFPVEATPTWGDHRTSYWRVPIYPPSFGSTQGEVTIDLTAPLIPGTYAIIFAAQAEFSGGYITSATQWSSGNPRWDNGDDIAGWTASQINFAIANGYLRAPQHGSGIDFAHFGATAVKIVVVGTAASDRATLIPGQT